MSSTNIPIEELKTQAAEQILNYCQLIGSTPHGKAKNAFGREARRWAAEWNRLDRLPPDTPIQSIRPLQHALKEVSVTLEDRPPIRTYFPSDIQTPGSHE